MKNKITPSVILLIITVIFFIAGIFFMGIQARQQISDTEQSLDAFISQVKDKQQALNDAQTSFSSAVKEKKDLLNLSPAKSFRSADCCAGASRYSGVIRSCHFRFQSGPQLIPEIFYKTFTIERTLTYRKDLYNEK